MSANNQVLIKQTGKDQFDVYEQDVDSPTLDNKIYSQLSIKEATLLARDYVAANKVEYGIDFDLLDEE